MNLSLDVMICAVFYISITYQYRRPNCRMAKLFSKLVLGSSIHVRDVTTARLFNCYNNYFQIQVKRWKPDGRLIELELRKKENRQTVFANIGRTVP